MKRLGAPEPMTFVVKVGQLYFAVDEERVVLWYNPRTAGDQVSRRIRLGKPARPRRAA